MHRSCVLLSPFTPEKSANVKSTRHHINIAAPAVQNQSSFPLSSLPSPPLSNCALFPTRAPSHLLSPRLLLHSLSAQALAACQSRPPARMPAPLPSFALSPPSLSSLLPASLGALSFPSPLPIPAHPPRSLAQNPSPPFPAPAFLRSFPKRERGGGGQGDRESPTPPLPPSLPRPRRSRVNPNPN